MGMSAITGRYAPPQKPYPAFRAREWLRNDGPVSVISQCYPFVCTKAAFQTPLHMRNNSLKRVGLLVVSVWRHAVCRANNTGSNWQNMVFLFPAISVA